MPCYAMLCHAAAAEAARSRFRAQHSQVSALLDAARQGECGAVESQLERGCPVDVADAEGRTALMAAAAYGNLVSGVCGVQPELWTSDLPLPVFLVRGEGGEGLPCRCSRC
jgi:hypothetical protein